MGKSHSDYQILTWIDKHTDEEDYKSKKALLDSAKLTRDDTTGYAKNFIEKEGIKGDGLAKYDSSIRSKITEKNETYISNLKSQIEKSNKEEEVAKIDIDKKYEEVTVDLLESDKNDRIAELAKSSFEVIDEAFDSGDIGQLKSIDTASDEQATRKGNLEYNMLVYGKGAIIPTLKNKGDIEGLRSLKSDIRGIRDESEVSSLIDSTIEYLKEQKEEEQRKNEQA